MEDALGLVEVKGLVAALRACDAAAKAAGVAILGYEQTKGGGQVVVKLGGDVGSVTAAVAAAATAASALTGVVAVRVIGRPSGDTRKVVGSR